LTSTAALTELTALAALSALTELAALTELTELAEHLGMSDNLETLTVDDFRSRIGQRFHIRARPDTELEAELIETRALGQASRGRRVPFSLSFRTGQLTALPQRIYEVAHDEIGSYDIFLVPVGPDGKGMVYEAVFT
jgi:hypothetical protein